MFGDQSLVISQEILIDEGSQFDMLKGICSRVRNSIEKALCIKDDQNASLQAIFQLLACYNNVKIKLKMKESPGEYKLAIYYSPLAAKLNQEQLEQIPENASGSAPSKKDETVKSTPLLEY